MERFTANDMRQVLIDKNFREISKSVEEIDTLIKHKAEEGAGRLEISFVLTYRKMTMLENEYKNRGFKFAFNSSTHGKLLEDIYNIVIEW